MKKFYILFLLFALCPAPHALCQQYGWQLIDPVSIPGTPDFSDVFFTDPNTGWITTTSSSNIYKTVDGTASFSTQTTPLGYTSAVHMLDASNGYSGGAGGWVYKTSDGGLNWNILASMGTLLDMSFPPDTLSANPVGYASGNSGSVWKIASGLTNLNSPSSSTLSGISAPSVNNVWVCGGNRIYYYNGTNFTSQIAPPGAFNDIHFINNQEGWVVGDFGVIGHTTNGGSLWVTQTNPDTQNKSLYGVFFLDSNNGWAVGNGGIILHTTNGGTNWLIEGEGLTTAFLRGVQFTSSTNGYVVGNNKTLFKYTELSTGVEQELENLKFEIYPNPAGSVFSVQMEVGSQQPAVLEIYDLNGRKLLEKQIPARLRHSGGPAGTNNAEIDASHLKNGMYFCRLIQNKGSVTKKVIIQK